MKTTVIVELSPEIYIAMASLCGFYNKDSTQLVEMAVEQLAADAKLITDTFRAVLRTKSEG